MKSSLRLVIGNRAIMTISNSNSSQHTQAEGFLGECEYSDEMEKLFFWYLRLYRWRGSILGN